MQRYKTNLTIAIAFLLICVSIAVAKVLQKEVEPMPERIILTWKTDPATSQAVTWRTSTKSTEGKAQIAIAEASPGFTEKAKTLQAAMTTITAKEVSANYFEVNFTQLRPATLYAYRVGNGNTWSEWFQFKTASDQEKPFSFIYFGDAQNEVKSMWSRVIRQAYTHLPDARFMLHAGDLINNANDDQQWGEWFDAGGWLHAMVPSIATPGNHEYYKIDDSTKALAIQWKPQFSFPENGPKGFEENVYYIDFQGTRIISLNSQAINMSAEASAIQAEWLVKVLANNPNTWTCITFHHPIFSSAQGRDNPAFRAVFKPIFDRYKVDLVLQGHDHTYGRGQNIPSGVAKKDEGAGTMYVVSVSGPKMYSLSLNRWMDRVASDTQLYQIIRIDGRELRFEAYTAVGELYDAFTLVKQDNGPNKLLNDIPANFPERIALPKDAAGKMSKEDQAKYLAIYPTK